MRIRTQLFFFPICLLAVILSGCLNIGSGTQSATRFFILKSLSHQHRPDVSSQKLKKRNLGIGPISIPKLLDRRHIITRINDTEIKIASFFRWAEPLPNSIARVLSENLTLLLDTDQVVVHPWFGSPPDYQIKIDIFQFDSPLKGDAILSTRWQIMEIKNKKIVFQKHSTFKESVDVSKTEDMIPVLSRLLENFSKQIASSLLTLG